MLHYALFNVRYHLRNLSSLDARDRFAFRKQNGRWNELNSIDLAGTQRVPNVFGAKRQSIVKTVESRQRADYPMRTERANHSIDTRRVQERERKRERG